MRDERLNMPLIFAKEQLDVILTVNYTPIVYTTPSDAALVEPKKSKRVNICLKAGDQN